MPFTNEEIKQKAFALERAGAPSYEIEEFVRRASSEVSAKPSLPKSKGGLNFLKPIQSFGKGIREIGGQAGKTIIQIPYQAARLGESIGDVAYEKIYDEEAPLRKIEIVKMPESLKPHTELEKIGQVVGETAQLALPVGGAGKVKLASKLAGPLAKLPKAAKTVETGAGLALEGLDLAARSSVQKGETEDFFKNAIIGGVLGGAGKAIGSVGSFATKTLPKRLFNTAVKPSLDETRKVLTFHGETLGEELIKRGISGTDQGLLNTSVKRITENENKLQNILAKSKETVARKDLGKYIDDAIKEAEETPGMLSEVEKMKAVLQEFPKEVPIQKANVIKRNLYSALRDTAFRLDPSLSSKKTAMKALARGIKEEIEKKTEKEVGKGVVGGINKELSVFGRLQDRMIDKIARVERNNILGIGDIGVGLGGALAGLSSGSPATAVATGVAGIVGRKVAGSTLAKTSGAVALDRIGKIVEKLPTDATGNISKAALYKALLSLTED